MIKKIFFTIFIIQALVFVIIFSQDVFAGSPGRGGVYLASEPGKDINPQVHKLSPPDCCVLKHKIKKVGEDGFYDKKQILASPNYQNCPVAGNVFVDIVEGDVIRRVTRSKVNKDPHWAGLCFLDGVKTVSEWILWIGLILASLGFVIAGFWFITSGGSTERIQISKKMFYFGLIGVGVAFASQLLPGFVRYLLGLS